MIGKDNQYLRFTKYDLRFLNCGLLYLPVIEIII